MFRLDVDEGLYCRSHEILACVIRGPLAAQDALACPYCRLVGVTVMHGPPMQKAFRGFARVADNPVPAYSVEFEDDGVLPPLLNHFATSCNRRSI